MYVAFGTQFGSFLNGSAGVNLYGRMMSVIERRAPLGSQFCSQRDRFRPGLSLFWPSRRILVMEATRMKVLGVISTTALFLLLGVTIPTFAQEEHQEDGAKPAQHEEEAKPAPKQDQTKPQKQEEQPKTVKKEETKPQKQEEQPKTAKQEEAKPQKQEEQ